MGDLPGSPSVAPSPPFFCGAAEPVEGDGTRRVGERFKPYILLQGFEFWRDPWAVHGKGARAPRSAVGGRGTCAFFFFSLSRFLSSFPFPSSFFRRLPAGREAPPSRGRGRAPAPSRFGSGAMDGPHALRVARRSPLKRGRGRHLCGCDHTSVNEPDPIRTPQLSALGLE